MKGFQQCSNNHFYKDELLSCPYCPSSTNSNQGDKTEVLNGNDNQKTIDTQKTQVFTGGGYAKNESNSSNSNQTVDYTKTIINSSKLSNINEIGDKKEQLISKRKLRGWLVSFDIEEFGIDFRIIEGRNSIGSASTCDITIKDNEISSMHALILCRKDKFLLSDEMSSNGTLLNGEDLTPRETYELNDGDEIKVGQTLFLFKKAFK
jgi:hypothetical protein